MIGPVPGMRNYWAAVGVMAGFCQAGGVGLCIAEWLVEGEPSVDVWAMDIARFGAFATPEYGTAKAAENYARRFQISYPNEELPAARRQKTTALIRPIHRRRRGHGRDFRAGTCAVVRRLRRRRNRDADLRRSNAFLFVAAECHAVREAVGAVEIANFAQHEFRGDGAEAFLDTMLAARLPARGRLVLSPMLTPRGRLIGDLSVARLADDSFILFGSGAAQEMHRRWFESRLPASGVHYRNASDDWHGIAISGPNSRELLSRITRQDVAAAALKFRDIRAAAVGDIPALLARVSFAGELGYEIYCAPPYQRKLHESIAAAGADLGLRLYGSRAMMSLRLEKNWGVWGLDYRPDFNAVEAGLEKFIADKDADFIGKSAFQSQQKEGAKKRLSTLIVETENIDPSHDEAIFHNGKPITHATSGGYAHHTKKIPNPSLHPNRTGGRRRKIPNRIIRQPTRSNPNNRTPIRPNRKQNAELNKSKLYNLPPRKLYNLPVKKSRKNDRKSQ